MEKSAVSSCFVNGTAFRVIYDRAAEDDAQWDSIMYYYTVISHVNFEDLAPSATAEYLGAEGILLKSVDPSMGRFERVGQVTCEQMDNVPLANILLPLGNEHELPAWSYDKITGRHTFYIV